MKCCEALTEFNAMMRVGTVKFKGIHTLDESMKNSTVSDDVPCCASVFRTQSSLTTRDADGLEDLIQS